MRKRGADVYIENLSEHGIESPFLNQRNMHKSLDFNSKGILKLDNFILTVSLLQYEVNSIKFFKSKGVPLALLDQ